jgi:TatD DNase family protein
MNLIDTHTHLFVNEFENDRNQLITNAISAGVTKMVLPGINSAYFLTQKELAEKFPKNCFIAAGLHPSDVKEDFEEELTKVESELKTGKYIAVGEIGIDLYWEKTFEQAQKKAFEAQLLWAKKFNLPAIIHVRDSFKEVFEITDKLMDSELKGIFHSFTGSMNDAKKIMEYKTFKIGFNGIITFKKNNLIDVLKYINLDYIVLETDSPYLAPVPQRGKRNESAFLIHIANKIAEIKTIELNWLVDITNKNAVEIFGNELLD